MSNDFAHDRSPRNAWHPSRLLVVEEWILCAALVAVGFVYMYICLPKPSVPATVARSMQLLKSPFSNEKHFEPVVSLVPASRSMIDAIRQAEKLERRGRFDDVTRRAWKAAADELHRFAVLPVSTGPGTHVRLFMKEAEQGRMAAIEGLLEDLLPGQYAALQSQRDAMVADPARADAASEVTWFTVAALAPEDVQQMAFDLARLHDEARRNVAVIGKYRELVGYDYWKAVCDAGASEPGFQARAALWQADFDARQAQFELAKATYERAFQAWRDACEMVPSLDTNPRVAEEMAEHVARYQEVVAALHEPAAVEL
jgi:hypothetical protein